VNLRQAGEYVSFFWSGVPGDVGPDSWRARFAPDFNKCARLLVRSFHAHRQAALVVTDAWAGLAALVEMIEVGGAANYTPVDTRGLKVRTRHLISMGPLMRDPITREIIPKARAIELETRQRFDKAMDFFERWGTVWADIKHRLLEDPVPELARKPKDVAHSGNWRTDLARHFLAGNQQVKVVDLVTEWGVGNTDYKYVAREVNKRLKRLSPDFEFCVGTHTVKDIPRALVLKPDALYGRKTT
jgi:hypothetical protein